MVLKKTVPNNTWPSSFPIIKLNIYKLHTWYKLELICFIIFMYFLENLPVDLLILENSKVVKQQQQWPIWLALLVEWLHLDHKSIQNYQIQKNIDR